MSGRVLSRRVAESASARPAGAELFLMCSSYDLLMARIPMSVDRLPQ